MFFLIKIVYKIAAINTFKRENRTCVSNVFYMFLQGEMTSTNMTISEETPIKLFYKMKIHLICEINQITRIDSVTINCTIGDDVLVLDNEFSCPGNSMFKNLYRKFNAFDITTYILTKTHTCCKCMCLNLNE